MFIYSPDMAPPNVLVIMTDEERYAPPYETPEVAAFRRTQMPSRERLRDGGLEFHRHYAGFDGVRAEPGHAVHRAVPVAARCVADRRGGEAGQRSRPWAGSIPTRSRRWATGSGPAAIQTHYRGKWHVSHADLAIPGSHEGLMASDDDGRLIPEAVEAYRKADRLSPFGFSGWIGREPHGANKSDCGTVRDGVFAEQVVDLFADLAKASSDGPWLAVASFVNPHDIAFVGGLYEMLLGFAPADDTVPDIAEAPSQGDSFAGRPACQSGSGTCGPR